MNNRPDNIEFLCVQHHKDAHARSDGAVGGGARPRVNALHAARARARWDTAKDMIASGMKIPDVAREMSVDDYSVYRWRKKYADLT